MNNIQDQKRFLGTKLVQSMMNQFQKKKKTDIGGRLYDEVGFVFDLNKKENV